MANLKEIDLNIKQDLKGSTSFMAVGFRSSEVTSSLKEGNHLWPARLSSNQNSLCWDWGSDAC